MAEVTVFVDDAVLGRLPGVCAKEGTPTGSSLRIAKEVGRSNRVGVLWLLAFIGPVGWLILVYLVSRDSGEHLAVELPWSDSAYETLRRARRLRNGALLVGVISTVGLIALTGWASLGTPGVVLTLAAAAAAVVATAVGEWRTGRASVGVTLDASRRWVTVTGVHSAFASACRASERATHL